MAQQTARIAVIIMGSASLSAAVALHGARVTCIEMPAAWDTANLSFQGSNDNSIFGDIFDDAGAELVVQAAAGRRVHLNADTLSDQAYIKVRSGVSASPVNQTSSRTLYLEVWS